MTTAFQGAIRAFEQYNAAPSTHRLFHVFDKAVADNGLWRRGVMRRFDRALCAGDSIGASSIAAGALERCRDAQRRGALRAVLAARAILPPHRNLAVADAVLAIARRDGEPVHRALLDIIFLRMRCRHQGSYQSLLDALIAMGAPEAPGACVQWIRHRWLYEAPSRTLLHDAVRLADRLGRPGGALLVEALAVAFRIHDIAAAENLLARHPGLRSQAKKLLPLAAHLGGAELAPQAALYAHLRGEAERLSDTLADCRNSLAIVGNSGCELGLGKGTRIDGRDMVVRFNYFGDGEHWANDYGRRLTHHGRGLGDKGGLYERSRRAGHAVLIQCDFADTPRDWSIVLALRAAGVRLATLPTGSHRALQDELKAEPSLGLAFLAHAKRVRPSLGAGECFGFAFTDQIGPNPRSSHYFEQSTPALTHNWVQERVIFDRLIRA